jgi:hypothetical protein
VPSWAGRTAMASPAASCAGTGTASAVGSRDRLPGAAVIRAVYKVSLVDRSGPYIGAVGAAEAASSRRLAVVDRDPALALVLAAGGQV